jgi:putative GTP pyrophosphokinase
MALIEAVDEYFIAAIDELAAATQLEREALETLTSIFYDRIGIRPNKDKTNTVVLQSFRHKLGEDLRQKILAMLDAKPIIVSMIKDNFDAQYIYRQPWILLAFLFASSEPSQTAEKWPLTPDELRPVYNDLGIRFPTVD